MSTLNLNQYAKVFTARLRSRAHNQAYAHTYQESRRRAKSPAAKVAAKKMEELDALCRLHRQTYDPGVKSKAMLLYQQLPLPLSTDDDPHFVLATRALWAAAKMDAASHPLTFSLLNHCTKHSYLLDGYSLVKLLHALRALGHPQSKDALRILLPRLMQVSEELTAAEAAGLLQIVAYFALNDVDLGPLCHKYGQLILETIAHVSLEDLHTCLRAVPLLPENLARQVMEAAAPKLIELMSTERQLFALLQYASESPNEEGGSPQQRQQDTPDNMTSTKRINNQSNSAAAGASSPGLSSSSGSNDDGTAPPDPTPESVKEPEDTDSTGAQEAANPTAAVDPETLRKEQLQILRQHLNVHRAARAAMLSLSYDKTCDGVMRRVLNEMVRSVLHLSTPSTSTASTGAAGTTAAAAAMEAASSSTLPSRMLRADVCETCRLLHVCSYRHLPALQRLTSRYLVLPTTRLEVRRQSPEDRSATELQEATMILEALGFFAFPLLVVAPAPASNDKGDATALLQPNGTLEAVLWLLGEEIPLLVQRSLNGTDRSSRTRALACVSRLMHSVTQLGRGEAFLGANPSGTSTRRTAETVEAAPVALIQETPTTTTTNTTVTLSNTGSATRVFAPHAREHYLASAVLPKMNWMWEGPNSVLQCYVQSATCHLEARRTARLLRRLTELCAVLQPSSSTAPNHDAAWEWSAAKAARAVMDGLSRGLIQHYRRGDAVRASGSVTAQAEVDTHVLEDVERALALLHEQSLVLPVAWGWEATELNGLVKELRRE